MKKSNNQSEAVPKAVPEAVPEAVPKAVPQRWENALAACIEREWRCRNVAITMRRAANLLRSETTLATSNELAEVATAMAIRAAIAADKLALAKLAAKFADEALARAIIAFLSKV